MEEFEKINNRYFKSLTPEQIHRRAVILHKNRKPCSCSMCRNPRQAGNPNSLHAKTMQEIRHIESTKHMDDD